MSDKEIQDKKMSLSVKIAFWSIVGVVSFVAWFYNTVAMPLEQLQVAESQNSATLSQIQMTLQQSVSQYQNLDKRVSILENKLGIQ